MKMIKIERSHATFALRRKKTCTSLLNKLFKMAVNFLLKNLALTNFLLSIF